MKKLGGGTKALVSPPGEKVEGDTSSSGGRGEGRELNLVSEDWLCVIQKLRGQKH